jgi:hypothetical protein
VLEEIDEGFTPSEEMKERPREMEEGPTSIDVIDKQISIGEAPATVPVQEEKPQEQAHRNFLFIRNFKASREEWKSD